MKPLFTLRLLAAVLLLTLLSSSTNSNAQTMTSVVSGVGDNYPALTNGRLFAPSEITCDALGNIYFSDNGGLLTILIFVR